MYKHTIFCIIITVGLTPSHLSAENLDLGTVIFANVIFRHGDRTPLNPYPNDPYGNESLWPVPFGQLTNLGKKQHLMLGRWLRKRYNHLLPQLYSLYDVYVQSTDTDRTLMSAECNLAGLYPPVGNQVWDTLEWMPIPVHTIPQKQDYILGGKKFCARYEREFKRIQMTGEIKRINEENEKLYEFLSEKTGNKVHDLISLEYVYNTLYIETIYNKTLPEWTKGVYPDKLKKLSDLSFEMQAYNEVLQRLKSGPLIGEMVKNMVAKSKKSLSPDRKLWIYSAHDDTLANLLMSLNLFYPHCPPYAATVLIELRVNSKNQHIVTISYKNSTGEPTLLTLPGCMTACPLNQFIRLTKNVIPEDWEKECSLEFMLHEYEVNVTAIAAILTVSTLMLIILILTIIGFIYWHYKRYHQYRMRYLIDID